MSGDVPLRIDDAQPHSARVWNYLLGGTDNFPADREFGDKLAEIHPAIIEIVQQCRAFLVRAVRYLASEAGIRQFLDVGTGLPPAENTHQVAQQVDPACRVFYVDKDPLVLARSAALLAGATEGTVSYFEADVREPEKILSAAAETLDFTSPIALMLLGVMGNVADAGEAYGIVNRYMAALPSGSYLLLQDGTNVVRDKQEEEALKRFAGERPEFGYYHLRTPDEIARFFDGLELVDPGVVSCSRWRPDPNLSEIPDEVDEFSGLARKP
jgi:hypothetical protein